MCFVFRLHFFFFNSLRKSPSGKRSKQQQQQQQQQQSRKDIINKESKGEFSARIKGYLEISSVERSWWSTRAALSEIKSGIRTKITVLHSLFSSMFVAS